MNEHVKIPITVERNLSLESQKLDQKRDSNKKRLEELRSSAEVVEKDGNKFFKFKSEADRQEYKEINEEMQEDLEKILNISEYKIKASPNFSDEIRNKSFPNSLKELERINEQNEKEIEDKKKDIENTTQKLNTLRAKLDMPPTDDIPSLVQKKEKLSSLLAIKESLENQLKIERQKFEAKEAEKGENSKIEDKGLNENIEEISNSLKKLSRTLDERNSPKFSKIFKDENGIRALTLKVLDSSNSEEVGQYFKKIGDTVGDFTNEWSSDDVPDNMRNVGKVIKELTENIKNFPSKIQNEENRKEFSKTISPIIQNLERASFVLIDQANNLQNYQNIRM